ncbi:uncharacterized protein CXorf38 homolog [Parambassis ranga]|uniref:Uncharacterized protein CXorf38 homolog n=1 Tax=Parambassis ranga TaxID=210632 RepID=A0A6P7K2J5_9TELE|nr:uncharacterized protein CXorf38 homolog [Parambassis ranga]
MVHEELVFRLNDRGYKNWLKAGRCLLILKDGLHPFTDHYMKAFHGDLLNQHSLLRSQCQTSACKPRGNKLSSACRVCSEWQKVILRHHRQPEATINWDNCFPPNWRTDYWEVAKAYMPRGQARGKGADQCDASALLNLINYCKYFSSVNSQTVREVIRFRNELMHSCDFCVTDEWIRRYHTTLKHFVNHVPEMARAGPQIDEMLTIDLTVYVSGVDLMDSAGPSDGLDTDSVRDTGAEVVSQWEAELLQEMLQEFLQGAAEDEDAKTQDTKLLKSLGGFLQANIDLGEKFSAELQAINSLEVRE